MLINYTNGVEDRVTECGGMQVMRCEYDGCGAAGGEVRRCAGRRCAGRGGWRVVRCGAGGGMWVGTGRDGTGWVGLGWVGTGCRVP